ncbi:hypothetical protein ACO0QE_003194 [Hanseniaspora vineae]
MFDEENNKLGKNNNFNAAGTLIGEYTKISPIDDKCEPTTRKSAEHSDLKVSFFEDKIHPRRLKNTLLKNAGKFGKKNTHINKFILVHVHDKEFSTPYEATLSCIQTGLKKARMKYYDMLITGFTAGLFFSIGGLLCTQVNGLFWSDPRERDQNIGFVRFGRGMVSSLGLFFVVVLGIELFNSNVMFLTVAWCVGKVTVFDMVINWSIVAIGNIASTLFSSYVILYLIQRKGQTDLVVLGSQYFMNSRLGHNGVQHFIRGCAANFLVCQSVYFAIMCKPIHAKLLMIFVGVFTFATVGFNHIITELFLIPFSIFNVGAFDFEEVKLYDFDQTTPLYADLLQHGKYREAQKKLVVRFITKMFIPSFFGNIVGGAVFAIIIPFYMHYYAVRQDAAQMGFKNFQYEDTRPDIISDSMVSKATRIFPRSAKKRK